MSIFIFGPDLDSHSVSIEWGLKRAGYDVVRWEGLAWQRERRAALTFGMREGVYVGERAIGPGDTVWLRRPLPVEPHPGVAATDQKFAREEYRAFYYALLYQIELTGAFCVNKWSAARRIENKPVQLMLAQQCGLHVPATVFTNAAPFVEELFQAQQGDIVHKTFLPHAWLDEVARLGYNSEATVLSRTHNYTEDIFAYAPGIYQQKIEKQHDVRITMIGRQFYPFAVVSDPGIVDWRLQMLFRKASIQPVELPASVEAALRKFADRADIVFGCFDMSVDKSGQWWFLEVNEAGQFLWIDEVTPEYGLYQPMLRFLSFREAGPEREASEFSTYAECKSKCEMKEWIVPLTAETKYATLERKSPETLAATSEKAA